MPDIPAISVVIPLYNKGPYIARALNSVLAQTFQDFEVIVVDGSTDDGAEVVKGFDDSRIRLIQEEGVGVSAARNQGIAAARAELIAFLDADDEWMPRHLETLMRLRENYPEAGLYATAYSIFTTRSELKSPRFTSIPPAPWEGVLPSYFLVAAMSSTPILTSSVGIPKDIFRESSGFRIGLNMFEDSLLWGQIALKHPVVFSWQRGTIYHLGSDNRLSNRIVDFEHPFVKIAEDTIRKRQISAAKLEDLKEYIARLKLDFARRSIALGKNELARSILLNIETKRYRWRKLGYLFASALPISALPETTLLNLWKLMKGG
jgi:glycosyltransferase involved in cell wall biosynthesis